jgi:methyl-accepting chemotaxis protein
MQRGTKEVEEGMKAVETTDKSFGEITNMAVMSSDEIKAISASALQQKSGAERVAKSIDGIASVAEESASASEESASSTEELTASMEDMTARAQELSEMAMALQKSASRFRLSEVAQSGKSARQSRKQAGWQEGVPTRRTIKRARAANVPKPKVPKKVDEALKKRGIEMDKEG